MFEHLKDLATMMYICRLLVFVCLFLMGFFEFQAWKISEEINKRYKSKAHFDREYIKRGVDEQKKKMDEISPKLDGVIIKFIEQNEDLANEKSKSLRLLAFTKYKDKNYIDALQLIDKAIDLNAANNKNLLVRAYICIELYDALGWGADGDSETTVDKFYAIAKNDLVSIMNDSKGMDNIYIEAFVRLQYLNSSKASMMHDKIEANKIYDTILEEIRKVQTSFPNDAKLKTLYKIIENSQKLHNEVDSWIK